MSGRPEDKSCYRFGLILNHVVYATANHPSLDISTAICAKTRCNLWNQLGKGRLVSGRHTWNSVNTNRFQKYNRGRERGILPLCVSALAIAVLRSALALALTVLLRLAPRSPV